jgi:hypothetical protein
MGTGRLVVLIFAGLIAMSSGCSGDRDDEGKPMARVGAYVFTEKAFRERAAEWAYYQGIGALSPEKKRALLEQEIDKELLIQEAVRLKLHEDDLFRRTIENYWEQTLVTHLLERKSEEIKDTIIVTSEEVQARYEEIVANDPDAPPLEELKASLEREIGDEKRTAAVEDWIKALRTKTKITIFEDNLKALR